MHGEDAADWGDPACHCRRHATELVGLHGRSRRRSWKVPITKQDHADLRCMYALSLSGTIVFRSSTGEHTMGTKLEQWRQADRQAHEAEVWLCGIGKHSEYAPPPVAEVAAAKELRQLADRLFDEAMQELQAEIAGREAGRRAASGPH